MVELMPNSSKYAAAHAHIIKPEAQILLECKNKLDWYEKMGQVLYYDRVQSGTLNFNGRYVKMGRSGMSDLVAYLNKDNTIWVCFLEVKASNKSRIQESQLIFKKKWEGIKNVTYHIVTDCHQIDTIVEDITQWQQKQLETINGKKI